MNHTTLPVNMDIDPLSYEYPAYNYPHPAPYTYPVKDEGYYQNYVPNGHSDYKQLTPLQAKEETDNKTEIKDIKTVPTRRKKEKIKSTYCSEKITDASFPFYGCSVCNISYKALHELDQHVTIHKNRMTSYRLRLRNQYKKKQLKKEKKRLKKIIKKELAVDIEIKPEDGYIGNEKAADFVSNEHDQKLEKHEEDSKTGLTAGVTADVPSNNLTSLNTISDKNGVSVDSSVSNDNVSESNGVSDNNGTSKDDENELNNLEKIYKCFACLKQFTLSYYLKLHVRSHTDEKPYKCRSCGQSFITASKLGRHDKRIHQTARFQCRICFKVFLRFDLLTAHFDKHHPEDKLEGEPYDYNAILPYLKELEEQLAQQVDEKPKVEDIWGDAPCPPQRVTLCEDTGEVKVEGWEGHCVVLTDDVKEETPYEDKKQVLPQYKVEVEVNFDDLKVKQEVSDDGGDAGGGGLAGEGDDGGGDGGPQGDAVKAEDSASDDDYFPSNTCAGGGGECPVCHKTVSSASYMRVHMRTHTGERPFKCYKCGRGFITSSKMHRHVLTHQDDKDGDIKTEEGEPKPAGEGDEIDEDDLPLKASKTKKRGKTKAKTADADGEGEEKPRRKHQKRPHACEYCNQKFLHANMLEVHRRSHAGEPLVLRCHYCLLEQSDGTALAQHEAQHLPPKPYLCTLCGKAYKKRETMVYHRKQHSLAPSFVCDVCSRRFPAACKLAAHQRSHRARVLRRYECPVCAHLFHTKYHVHMHLATHQKEGLIQEQQRPQVLAMALQNARPVCARQAAHSGDERSRVCNICGEVFHHFFHLEEHLKGHAASIAVEELDKPADKKHVCPLCNKGFKLHYYLKLHSFTHSKEKPFICQQCGKGFITKGKLKRHLETHTGLKKYQCHICCKFFTRPSYLRIHIRTIHGTQDYNFRLQPPPAP
ncbi:unnamed protein product [Chrysodeixis includens]|uniref:C2H2-type domain-containing protein n=1 Tax=Chrysodeixis includens TaxID=689277 RepID=A0A9N8L0R9_CHRIL|nr:unnamed protein product [Chrysodeixis includens]